jgi:hypothetical protein
LAPLVATRFIVCTGVNHQFYRTGALSEVWHQSDQIRFVQPAALTKSGERERHQ